MSIFSKWFSSKDKEREKGTSIEQKDSQFSASDYCEQGKKSLDAGKYVEAMEFFQAAIETDRRFEKAYLLLSEAYEKHGNVDKAKSALYGLLAVDPNNEKALKRIEELNGKTVTSVQNIPSATSVSTQTYTSVPDSPISRQSQSSRISNYRIIDGKPEDAFDFFIMFDDGNRVYFKCKQNFLMVTKPNESDNAYWDGFIKPKGDLVIPKEINYKGKSLNVIAIGRGAFSGCDLLHTIELPDSVRTIDSFAFSLCSKLKSINLPNSIYTIGSNAFSFCDNLLEVDLPWSLSVIENDVFSYCNSLKIVTIPQNVRMIKSGAFYLIGSGRSYGNGQRLCLVMKGIPPICEGGLGRDDVMVKVPHGMFEAYMTAPYWQCLNIKEETC